MNKLLYLPFVAVALSIMTGSMYSCSKENDDNSGRGGETGGTTEAITEWAQLIVGTWDAVVEFNPFADEDPDFVYYETWVFSAEGEMSYTYPHNVQGETTTLCFSYTIESKYLILDEEEQRIEILNLNATEMQLRWSVGGEVKMASFVRATDNPDVPDNPDSPDNPENPDNPDNPEPDGIWVDLGLPSGLLWATHNVGATAPEENGDYFAWGETTTKSSYSWDTYAYYYSNYGTIGVTRYTGSDGLTTLLPEDDAATAKWGDGARTPTKDEWAELIGNTTVEWTTQDGVNGRRFIAPNGKSLFLPAADGHWEYEQLYGPGTYGFYWSATPEENAPEGAWYFFFNQSNQEVSHYYRCSGFSVRPVRDGQD